MTTDTETVTDIAEEQVEGPLSKCEIFWSAMHKDASDFKNSTARNEKLLKS